ncbi:hypothetical protein [Mycoplasma procyoni]|uniref:hypothetical protein n=1 Tax=Mycoplasma procyoni TaxID=568784 RepID=UPI00197B4D19|nr:hypothetical protein [Mycoplasma procyoni]MBN3534519.1 hypothetical protein [Mycoplasma procyoni]
MTSKLDLVNKIKKLSLAKIFLWIGSIALIVFLAVILVMFILVQNSSGEKDIDFKKMNFSWTELLQFWRLGIIGIFIIILAIGIQIANFLITLFTYLTIKQFGADANKETKKLHDFWLSLTIIEGINIALQFVPALNILVGQAVFILSIISLTLSLSWASRTKEKLTQIIKQQQNNEINQN